LQVMDVNRVFDDVETKIVGLAIGGARLGAAAGQEHGETARMMIASGFKTLEIALSRNAPSEFTAPDNKRILEQAPLLQIGN